MAKKKKVVQVPESLVVSVVDYLYSIPLKDTQAEYLADKLRDCI